MSEKKYVTPEIYYIDNFLPLDFIDNLNHKLMMSSWTKHSSSIENNNFFWATHITEDVYKGEIDYFEKVFNDVNIIRIYANGQSST